MIWFVFFPKYIKLNSNKGRDLQAWEFTQQQNISLRRILFCLCRREQALENILYRGNGAAPNTRRSVLTLYGQSGLKGRGRFVSAAASFTVKSSAQVILVSCFCYKPILIRLNHLSSQGQRSEDAVLRKLTATVVKLRLQPLQLSFLSTYQISITVHKQMLCIWRVI